MIRRYPASIQYVVHGLHRGQGVTFRAARATKVRESKLRLQLSDVVPAQRKIMGEISRTAAMSVMHGQSAFEHGNLGREHVRVKQGHLRGEPFQQKFVSLKQRLAFRQRLI